MNKTKENYTESRYLETIPISSISNILMFPNITYYVMIVSSVDPDSLMLYIFGCGIYTAYRQTWNQFFILLVAEFICFILFFGATAITEGIGRFSEWLAEL